MTFRGSLCCALVWIMTWMDSPGATPVFEADAEWRWLKGTREASSPDGTAWRAVGFDDSQWDVGRAPFFYGEDATGTLLADMRGGYTCIYLRRKFVVSEPAGLGAVRLRALSDDGFAAWVNGRPVARFNVPAGDFPYDATALGTFNEPLPTETYEVADFANVLVAGTNVISVQACNASLTGSSDFLFEASLETEIDDVAPVAERILPAPGSRMRELALVTVVFSEPVEGVEAGDLRINGAGAESVTGFGGDQYVFEFPAVGAGTVMVEWAGNAGIHDRSPRQNPFGGGSWQYTVDPDLPPPGVTISEFMADNDQTLNDEDGDASDWIEIENASDQVVSLAGWALTDDAGTALKWRFPAVSLAANGRMIVFASGKDRTSPTAPLHTNFRLGREGGYLALSRPDGSVASAFAPTYPPQTEDVSYGHLPTDPLKTGFFPQPTPGEPNAEGGAGFSPDVVFSRIGGTFEQAFSLNLRAAAGDAVVRYTLDGRVPTESSPQAVGPIPISTSTRVRARAYAPGLLPGRLMAEYYVQLNPTAAAVSSSLPLVVMHSYGGGAVPPDGEYPAFVSMYEPRAGVSSLTNAPDLRTRARVNIRGSSTLYQPKRNYSVEFRDEQEADRRLSPLGLPADSDWILYAPNNFEPVLIHNPFIYRLSREIGRYAPRTRFVEVYVQTGTGSLASSHYVGIYVLMEKIKQAADRVDVAKLEPEHRTAPNVTGGYLLKIDRLDPGDSGFSAGGQYLGFVEPKEAEMRLPQRAPQLTYIRDYIDRFGQALNAANWRDPVVGWRAYVDEDAWIDHHILNVMAFNVDALRLSAFFYKPREGKLTFGPIWDFDRALNSTDGRDANARVWRSQVSDQGTDFFNYPWWGRLFRDPDFWQKWIDRYQELRRGTFDTNSMNRVIDEMADQVRPAQPREAERWQGFTTPRGSYANEVTQMKAWLGRRVHFMDTNFLAAPTIGTVTGDGEGTLAGVFTGPAGATIYYTTDGTDPRAPGGSIAASARLYSGPVPVGETGVIRARSHNPAHRNLTGANNPPLSSPWSGPVELRRATLPDSALRPLVFTEIHARPGAPTAQELATNPRLTRGDFEFVELRNAGARVADLGDLRFVAGVRFSFATSSIPVLEPGARLVLVRNRSAFLQRYGAVDSIAGEYEGALSAAGETLQVEDGLGRVVATARFRPSLHPGSDGLGYSLVLRDEAAGEAGHGSDEGDWRVSGQVGGSPGAEDPVSPETPRVVIHEVLANPDAPQEFDGIELHNPGGVPAGIGGWYLTDDREDPFKFRIADGTVIAPGGYLWLDEEQFGSSVTQPTGFQLSSLGEEVWIFAADGAGRLTGYAHGFEFGASPIGVSFGRELDCLGRESLLAQMAVTPGAPNTGPRASAMMISEIHYRPPDIEVGVESWNDAALEFIELVNVTEAPVSLFDPAHPTNTWRLHLENAVAFTFPGGVMVPSGGTVVVVNFDPATNPQALQRFRSVYGTSPATPLFGPFSGSLPNGSGRVDLTRPEAPRPPSSSEAGLVPYVLVDRVTYADDPPWTALADGTGRSLARVGWDRVDAGASSWVAAAPTPGTLPDGSEDSDGDGMPDGWEAAYCLDPNDAADAMGDADADGAFNRDEYLTRTRPRDGTDVLAWKNAGIDDTGRTRFSFEAKAGLAYVVEVSDVVQPGVWERLLEVPAQSETRTVTVEDLVGGGTRYYRIVLSQVP